MKLEAKHWAVIAGLITGCATQLLSAQHGWSDIATPGFVAGLLIQVASAITAIFVGAPGAAAALDQANKNTDLANASTRAALADPLDLGSVDPKRFIGTGNGKGVGIILACVIASSACSLSLKQNTVAGLQATETALELSHDAERRLCAPNADQTKGIAHCDGPLAAQIHLTDAVHLKAAALYSKAFDLQAKAARAAKAWRAGNPVPSDVASYQAALHDILNVLSGIVPQQHDAFTKLQEAIAQAADLAKLAGVK